MKYIPEAVCMTDPVKMFTQLMKQRRRWINGSWFALFYVLKMYPIKIQTSTHSQIRKFAFNWSMIYAQFNALNAYIIISLYYVFLQMTIKEILGNIYISQLSSTASLDSIFVFLYLLGIFALFYFSLFYSNPDKKIYVFQLISSFLGIFMLI